MIFGRACIACLAHRRRLGPAMLSMVVLMTLRRSTFLGVVEWQNSAKRVEKAADVGGGRLKLAEFSCTWS